MSDKIFDIGIIGYGPVGATLSALLSSLGLSVVVIEIYEGVSPTGSHKPNTAVPQAFFNKEEGVKKIFTETGAGQWGSSLAFAGQMFGIDIEVFMVKISFDQ